MLFLLFTAVSLQAQIALTLSDVDQHSLSLTHTYPGVNDIIIRYGSSYPLSSELNITNCPAPCSFKIEDLDPASSYYVEIRPASSPAFVLLQGYFITSSYSSGQMRVYFTRSVDSAISNGPLADGESGEILEAEVIRMIHAAQTSIDITMYNINRRPIADALTAAHQRGVIVRYVTGDDTSNSALRNPDVPFPVLEGNSGDPLMHNKFIVIDAEDSLLCQVITGATNFTDGQIFEDYNNMVVIQDQSLARIFQKEFEEMWGSDNPLPNLSNAKFGWRKTDNTPHQLKVKDVWMEVYFSPSDQTTFQIDKQLRKAKHDISCALLLLTRNELANALLAMHQKGVQVRGLVNNINDTGSDFSFLQANGVNIWQHDEGSILHHKYAIIDGLTDTGIPTLITGSHNWTAAAEESNDENTVIFHDKIMANIFLQEFQARWCETRPAAECRLMTGIDENAINTSTLKAHYNSADNSLYIFSETDFQAHAFYLYDMQGRIIMGSRSELRFDAGSASKFALPLLQPGMYFLKLEGNQGNRLFKFVVC